MKTIYGITCSLLLCGVYASPAEAIQNVTELRNAIVHPTNGCGGAVVMTPALELSSQIPWRTYLKA